MLGQRTAVATAADANPKKTDKFFWWIFAGFRWRGARADPGRKQKKERHFKLAAVVESAGLCNGRTEVDQYREKCSRQEDWAVATRKLCSLKAEGGRRMTRSGSK